MITIIGPDKPPSGEVDMGPNTSDIVGNKTNPCNDILILLVVVVYKIEN